jgi:hypothetical protein
MSEGIETFGSGWKNNQSYLTSLTAPVVDTSGFTWVPVGSLNTQTNSYLSISTFITPNLGLKLAAVVTVTLGVSLSPIVLTITYHNQSGVAQTVTCSFPQGSSVGTCVVPVLPLGDQVASVTIASVTPVTSGTIQIWSPLSTSETFSSSFWGLPDPGL